MKRFTIFLLLTAALSIQLPAQLTLYFTEISCPSDNGVDWHDVSYFELYNYGSSDISLFSDQVCFSVQDMDGDGSWIDYPYPAGSGVIPAHSVFVIAVSFGGFKATYGFGSDKSISVFNNKLTGHNPIFLYQGSDHTTGTLIDAYGVANTNGAGTDWDYSGSKAVRLASVTGPNTTWTASEWDIPGSAAKENMTPKAYKENVNWVGNSSSNWSTKGTDYWDGSHGYIPDASFNVTIPSGTTYSPSINAQAACNDLTINSSASRIGNYQPLHAYLSN